MCQEISKDEKKIKIYVGNDRQRQLPKQKCLPQPLGVN